MNKKYIGIVLGILLVGIATALVVDYYSNTAIVHVGDMQQPLHITLSNGGAYVESPLELGGGVAGSTITIYAQIINSANNAIPTNLNIVINDTLLDVTCADVTGITVDGVGITGTCSDDNAGTITFVAPETASVGSNVYTILPTFNAGAVGDYSIATTAKL